MENNDSQNHWGNIGGASGGTLEEPLEDTWRNPGGTLEGVPGGEVPGGGAWRRWGRARACAVYSI